MSLPTLRDRVVYHERLAAHVVFHSQPQVPIDELAKPSDESDSEFDHDSDVFSAHKVDGSSIGFEEMTLDILMVRTTVCLMLEFGSDLEF